MAKIVKATNNNEVKYPMTITDAIVHIDGSDKSVLSTFLKKLAAEIVNPDWSQNDSTKIDYIKNRTHYAGTIEHGEEEIFNGTVSWGGSAGEFVKFEFPELLHEGVEYTINFNGNTYQFTCVKRTINNEEYLDIGDEDESGSVTSDILLTQLASMTEAPSIDFCCTLELEEGDYPLVVTRGVYTEDVLQKLDTQYLPDEVLNANVVHTVVDLGIFEHESLDDATELDEVTTKGIYRLMLRNSTRFGELVTKTTTTTLIVGEVNLVTTTKYVKKESSTYPQLAINSDGTIYYRSNVGETWTSLTSTLEDKVATLSEQQATMSESLSPIANETVERTIYSWKTLYEKSVTIPLEDNFCEITEEEVINALNTDGAYLKIERDNETVTGNATSDSIKSLFVDIGDAKAILRVAESSSARTVNIRISTLFGSDYVNTTTAEATRDLRNLHINVLAYKDRFDKQDGRYLTRLRIVSNQPLEGLQLRLARWGRKQSSRQLKKGWRFYGGTISDESSEFWNDGFELYELCRNGLEEGKFHAPVGNQYVYELNRTAYACLEPFTVYNEESSLRIKNGMRSKSSTGDKMQISIRCAFGVFKNNVLVSNLAPIRLGYSGIGTLSIEPAFLPYYAFARL